jgi:hypothetical protein
VKPWIWVSSPALNKHSNLQRKKITAGGRGIKEKDGGCEFSYDIL